MGGGNGKGSKGGRPPDQRPQVTVRLTVEDHAVLCHVEQRTSLAVDELVRLFVHVAIWETRDVVPNALQEALSKAREERGKP